MKTGVLQLTFLCFQENTHGTKNDLIPGGSGGNWLLEGV